VARLYGFAHELSVVWRFRPSSWPRVFTDILGFRVLRFVRLPSADAQRTVAMRDGTLLTYRLNRGDIQAIREIWLDEVYMPPAEARGLRTIVDLGANIGFTSVYLAQRLRPDLLIAVEPDPGNAAILRVNLAQNNIAGVVIEAAVGPADGTARFRRDASSNLGALADDGDLTVPLISLPSIIEEIESSTELFLLKLDIEGGEEELFAADVSWLQRVGCLIAELHPGAADVARIVRSIEHSGLRLRRSGGRGTPPACWIRAAVSAVAEETSDDR
jgi:FkbM family methyltransferase